MPQYGATGSIRRYDFEQLITFDAVLDLRIRHPGYYLCPAWWETAFIHYFKDGVEVGYWCALMGFGFIFEKPRVWDPSFMRLTLDEHSDMHGILMKGAA